MTSTPVLGGIAIPPFYFLLATVLVCGCQTKSEVRRAQEMEQIKTEVRAARGDRADIEVMSEELKVEISRVSNTVEEQNQHTRQQLDELRRDINTLATRMQALEQRAVNEELAAHQAPAAPAQTPGAGKSPAGFEAGKRLFEEGKFEEAADVFKNVAKNRPRSDEGKRSQYWLAESYFTGKDYPSAALEFSEFEKRYPKDALVPNAVYRQAQSFRNLNKPKEARLFYQELIERYPKNALSAKAKNEMKKLK